MRTAPGRPGDRSAAKAAERQPKEKKTRRGRSRSPGKRREAVCMTSEKAKEEQTTEMTKDADAENENNQEATQSTCELRKHAKEHHRTSLKNVVVLWHFWHTLIGETTI